MGRNKGIGMPRAKKKVVEMARARIMATLKPTDTNDAQPTAAVDAAVAVPLPCGAVPTRAAAARDALDDELRAARKEAREAAWVAEELETEVPRSACRASTCPDTPPTRP